MKKKYVWIFMVGKTPTAVFKNKAKAQLWMKLTDARIPKYVPTKTKIVEVELID